MSATSHTKKDCQLLVDTSYIRSDIGNFELSVCGRHRIYPRLPSQAITLLTGAGADQYGAWTEVIPGNLVPFDFNLIGVFVETVSATGTYMIQFGDCPAGGTPGANEEQGEVRFRATSPLNRSTEVMTFGCRGIKAYRRVMARMMNDSGGDNATMAVVVRRYVEVSGELAKWPAWPW